MPFIGSFKTGEQMKQNKVAAILTITLALMASFTVRAQIRPMFYNRLETNSMSQLKKGENALKAGHLKVAERNFKKAIKLMKVNYQAYGYLGILETQKGNLKEAQINFRESVKTFEQYKTLMLGRIMGYVRQMESNVGNSRLAMDKARDPSASETSGNVELSYKNKKDVIKDYNEEYSKLKEMKYPAFFQFKYGNLMLAAGYGKAAKKHYLAAVEADPTFKDTYANLAVCWFMEGNCKEAVKAYKKAKELKAEVNPKFEADLKKKCGAE
jgi:tetratricopeptide (TPR) repeat protein